MPLVYMHHHAMCHIIWPRRFVGSAYLKLLVGEIGSSVSENVLTWHDFFSFAAARALPDFGQHTPRLPRRQRRIHHWRHHRAGLQNERQAPQEGVYQRSKHYSGVLNEHTDCPPDMASKDETVSLLF